MGKFKFEVILDTKPKSSIFNKPGINNIFANVPIGQIFSVPTLSDNNDEIFNYYIKTSSDYAIRINSHLAGKTFKMDETSLVRYNHYVIITERRCYPIDDSPIDDSPTDDNKGKLNDEDKTRFDNLNNFDIFYYESGEKDKRLDGLYIKINGEDNFGYTIVFGLDSHMKELSFPDCTTVFFIENLAEFF